MIDFRKMIATAVGLVVLAILILLFCMSFSGCIKQRHCITDKIKGIYGCNRAGYCQVELENGEKGWTDNKLFYEHGDHATICKRDL